MEFSKKYNPSEFEKNIYSRELESGSFKPNDNFDTFYLPMPPPNITGVLHLGHALMLTLQDVMTRYHRMAQFSTLWLPGTDHASIATEARVNDRIQKNYGKNKFELGREKFLIEAEKWQKEHGGKIQEQTKMIGASCDWSLERFTMDKGLQKTVNDAFVELYNRGLIYKGDYMANYSPSMKTVLSDIEVTLKEEDGFLYYITYFVSSSDSEVVIATTRPETLLGDVAVAVSPDDKRFRKLVRSGKGLILPIINKEIPLIVDDSVNIEFGTGAVKITPAHDPNDFEVALRHNLPTDNIVVDKDGYMTEAAGIFAGQHYLVARENIVELLKSKGNLQKVEKYRVKKLVDEKFGTPVESVILKQWFVKIEPIVQKVIDGYEKGEFEIIPFKFNKVFERWIYNLRDWSISRQLWYGHQIPVWYDEEGNEYCAHDEKEAYKIAIEKTGNANIKLTQEEDILDTWFSSALWPFSILDYDITSAKQGELFQKFYPAQMLETGHDIIFFWVIRMLLLGYEFTNQTPFKKIYLHGLVRDKNGKKMSKSLGNGIDPIDMIEKYSADALRMTLVIGNTPGNDLNFDEKNVENSKLFLNKLWNASRFVHANIGENVPKIGKDIQKLEKKLIDNFDDLEFHEKWILLKLTNLSNRLTKAMQEYSFSEAGEELLSFTRNEFCDYFIEEYKIKKSSSKFGDEVLVFCINILLRLWHPYIPFVTSRLWELLGFEGLLLNALWINGKFPKDEIVIGQKDIFMECIKDCRRLRAENNIAPSELVAVSLLIPKSYKSMFEKNMDLFSGLVKAENITILSEKSSSGAYIISKSGVEIWIDLSKSMDLGKEKERIKAQILDTKEYIAILDKKLLNESFVRNAPSELVRAEMEKKKIAEDKLAKLEDKLGKL